MNFLEFVGNEGLKTLLSSAADRHALSHAYIIHGPKGAGKRTLAGILSAALVCSGEGELPCLKCPHCRKALRGIHPDVITEDGGGKDIGVTQIRDLRRDAYIRPNEAQKKVYIIPDGHTLKFTAQNAMLKLLEEGPPYAAFLILTENAAALLPTVRSRCVELAVSPVLEELVEAVLRRKFPDRPQEEIRRAAACCDGIVGRGIAELERGVDAENAELSSAITFGEKLSKRDELELLSFCIGLEKMNRNELCAFLERGERLLLESMHIKLDMEDNESGGFGRTAANLSFCLTKPQIMGTIDVIRRLRGYCDFNVGVGHVLGLLAADCWEMIR